MHATINPDGSADIYAGPAPQPGPAYRTAAPVLTLPPAVTAPVRSAAPRDTRPACACAPAADGTATATMLCPRHADEDPCATLASVTGRRRKGPVRGGTCTSCGWSRPAPPRPP